MPGVHEYIKDNYTPTSREVIRVIGRATPEYFTHFGARFEENDKGILVPAKMGKFVAAGAVIVVAPFANVIKHPDIVSAVEISDLRDAYATELDAARQAGTRILYDDRGGQATDAGLFRINDGTITIGDMSYAMGAADDAGREKTVEALRLAVSSDFTVLSIGKNPIV